MQTIANKAEQVQKRPGFPSLLSKNLTDPPVSSCFEFGHQATAACALWIVPLNVQEMIAAPLSWPIGCTKVLVVLSSALPRLYGDGDTVRFTVIVMSEGYRDSRSSQRY